MVYRKYLDFKVDRSGLENYIGNCGDVFFGDNYFMQKLGGFIWEVNVENLLFVFVKNFFYID